jgi:hypothetical protein
LYGYLEGEGWPRSWKCAGVFRGYSKCEFYELCNGHPHTSIEDWAKAGPPMGYVKKGEE